MSHVDPRKVAMPDADEHAGCHVSNHVDWAPQQLHHRQLIATLELNVDPFCSKEAVLHIVTAVNNAE